MPRSNGLSKPRPEPASQGVACCDVVNRGGVFADGKFFFNTLDGNTIALDADTGKMLWKTKLGHIDIGETFTMAPFVVKGKVLVGNSGGEFGVRGWVAALDAGTGKLAWKAFNTGPDKDVLIGPEFHPFYDSDKGEDLGVKTWPPDAWRIGGGTMWGWIAYDPDLNLIFHGTANPGPWNQEQRPGDNKWTAGVFARDPDTGAAKWFYQANPHDEHDYDGINEIILLDVSVDGKLRKVLLHPDRNGYLYMLDRTTGEIVSADPYGYVNSITGIIAPTIPGTDRTKGLSSPNDEHCSRHPQTVPIRCRRMQRRSRSSSIVGEFPCRRHQASLPMRRAYVALPPRFAAHLLHQA